MTAIAYDTARARTTGTAGRARVTVPHKGLLARFVDALVESRLQQAHREIIKHAHLFPRDKHADIEAQFRR